MNLPCKGCTSSVIVPKELIEIMLEDAEKKGFAMVDESIYENRLAQCESCPALQYGTTCKYNGGLVQYKANLVSGACPCPTGAKWELVAG